MMTSLSKHICKTSIRNPTYGNLYLKNWILTKGCTPIHNKHFQKEVVTMHWDDCWRRICPCPELKPNISDKKEYDDEDVFHCKVSKFVRNGLVNWSDIMMKINS